MEPLEGEIILPGEKSLDVNQGRYPPEDYCDSAYCKNPAHFKPGERYCDLPNDCGRMQENVEELAEHMVGHRIVKTEKRRVSADRWRAEEAFVITLDNGVEVQMFDTDDCCAYTRLENFLGAPDLVEHIITGVGTTDGFCTWHIFCDFGDIMKLDVSWNCGNPFYYGYGFDIKVAVNADTLPQLESGKKAIES